MHQKMETLTALYEEKVVAVIRGATSEKAEDVVLGAREGGIRVMEITYTVPGATDLIKKLSRQSADWIIGAGTVLDDITARLAILAGARFIVSPSFNKDTAVLCNRYHIPYIPGCYTMQEIVQALESGSDIIKIFPGNISGPSGLQALKGPLPQADLMPSGGVNAENAGEWLRKGAAAISVGSLLYKDSHNEIVEASKSIMSAVKQATNG